MDGQSRSRFGSAVRWVGRRLGRRLAGRGWRLAVLAGAAALLAGCSAMGPTDNPVARKLTWFSYLNGDDLRVACGRDGTDRFRLVFNADYNRHIRTYDVTADRERGGAAVEARVIEATDLARLSPQDPLSAARGSTSRIELTPNQFAYFIAGLRSSGVFEAPPNGLRLPSNGVYWLVNGCQEGHWFFNAFPYPSGRFADIRFPEALRDADRTGIPFPALPPPEEAPRSLPSGSRQAEGGVFFELEVADAGLAGPTHLFGPWTLGNFLTR